MHTNYAPLGERAAILAHIQAANGRHVYERQPRVPVGEGFGGTVGVGVGECVGVIVGVAVGVGVGGCVGVVVGWVVDVGETANVGVGAAGLGVLTAVGVTGTAGPGAFVTTI